MKIFILLISLGLATSTLLFAADSNDLLMFYSESDAPLVTEYKIRFDSIRGLPKWNPEKEDAPLSLKKAIEVAKMWVMKKNPDHPELGVRDIHLGQIQHINQATARWFYRIKFHQVMFTGPPTPDSVVVLMDGTLVEPAIHYVNPPRPEPEAEQ